MSASQTDDYVPLANALSTVERLEEQMKIILGMDGFILSEGQIEPDMDMIADFSELSTRSSSKEDQSRQSVIAARRILEIWLRENKDRRAIEFVVAD